MHSPFQFVLFMDTAARGIEHPTNYTLLYLGDIFLAPHYKADLDLSKNGMIASWNTVSD